MNPAPSSGSKANTRRCGVKTRNVIFVAGTDTGVGKSFVTGLLARYLLEKGHSVITQKWIQTGCRAGKDDIYTHMRFMGKARQEYKAYMPLAAPYVFRFASSPHLAARLEGRTVDMNKIIGSLKTLSGRFDFVIVEGTGGLMVPINEKVLTVDLIEKLNIPVILVAANRLGVINHALLSIEALRARKIKNLGMIFNDASEGRRVILDDNPRIVEKLTGTPVLGRLPRTKNVFRLRKLFEPIGKRIFADG